MNRPTSLLVLVVLFVPFSGCFDDDASASGATTTVPTSGTDGLNGTNGPAPDRPQIQVTVTNKPAKAKVGEAIEVKWDVSVDNDTQVNGTTTMVRWGPSSVPDDELTDDAYANESGRKEDQRVPGSFNASFKATAKGQVYARALLLDGDTPHWSDEINITVESSAPPPPPPGPVTTVSIVALGPVGTYNARSVTIKAGDGVKWTNMDPVIGHTATSDAGAPEAFSASAGAGATSGVVYFTVKGTYTYHCAVHPATMSGSLGGTIVVT